jgi:deoxyribose-phosphate aldolase
MTDSEILAHVDHTLLKATADTAAIDTLCKEAIQYKCASVCIPPYYVKHVHDDISDTLNIGTVIGFPLGYHSSEIKVAEAMTAVAYGAGEIDMVVNIGMVKNQEWDRVLAEILTVQAAAREKEKDRAAGGKPVVLKVIVETCYLTDEEKKILCEIVTRAKADYIKTSTGFGTPGDGKPSGATLEDVALFKQYIGPDVKIKASGGIKTREQMVAFLEAGCDRLGTSSATQLMSTH